MTLRIAYAGSIQIVAQFSTLITGLVFVTLIARNLQVDEFGLWQVLGSVVSLSLLPAAPLSYWALRYLSRGDEVGKTAVFGSLLLLPIVFAIYAVLVLALTTTLTGVLFVALILSSQIPFIILSQSMKIGLQASRPQFLGLAIIPFEIGKVAAALYFLLISNMGLVGAILSLTAGQVIHAVFVGYWSRDMFRGKVRFDVLKSWLKAAWVGLLSTLVARLWIADSIMVALLLGSTTVVGFFQAARTFALIIALGEVFLSVLYPKLMRDGLGSDISVSLRLQMLVQIPLATGALIMAEPLLAVLRLEYTLSATVLRLLVLAVLVQGIEHLLDRVLLGRERRDEKIEDLRSGTLRGTWLVKLPLIDLAKGAFYLGALALVLTVAALQGASEITMAVYWSIVFGIVVVPFTFLKVIAARKQLPRDLPLSTITRNAISGVGMGLFLLLYRFYYPWTPAGFFATLNYVLLPGFASLGVYAILNFLIDPYFRGIVIRSFDTAKKVFRSSG